MKYSIFIFSLLLSVTSWAQDDDPDSISEVTIQGITNQYPEGIYTRFEDIISGKPRSMKKVESRNVLRPKEKIDNPLIDNCYFYYQRTNKRVKDAFAISYEGSLYIHVKSMQKMMDKKDRKQKIDYQDSFIRVVDQGRFLYLEGYVKKGGGLGFSLGGGPISIGTGGPKEELRGIVFDFESELFDLFRDCQDFDDFLRSSNAITEFKCSNKSIPLQVIRKIIFEMNDSFLEQQ